MQNIKNIIKKFKQNKLRDLPERKNNLNRKKIHRRYTPQLSCRIPRGIASKFISRINNHNWHNNFDLINLRRNNGMRIHARSELCETLTVLSAVLIIYCNYSLYNEYPFEISAPFEIIASSMSMLHIYSNGRKSYDPPLHALRILEKLKYLIIFRGMNPDTGHYKPLRIWLTKKFFTSRGITLQELRLSLIRFEKWVIRHKLTSDLLRNSKKHLIKMRSIGIDLIKYPSLRKLLLKARRNILGSQLINQANNSVKYNKLTEVFEAKKKKTNFTSNKSSFVSSQSWYNKFINWSMTKMPYQVFLLEKKLREEEPQLMQKNPEKYYKLLVKRGKNI